MNLSPQILVSFFWLFALLYVTGTLLGLVLHLLDKKKGMRPGWWRRWWPAAWLAGAAALLTAGAVPYLGFLKVLWIGPWAVAGLSSLVGYLDISGKLRSSDVLEQVRVTPEGLKMVHDRLHFRARQFAASALAGHIVGFLTGGALFANVTASVGDFLLIFGLYTFWIAERFGQFGGLVALRPIDPLGFRQRLWKEYGLLIGAVGLILVVVAGVVAVSAFFIRILSR